MDCSELTLVEPDASLHQAFCQYMDEFRHAGETHYRAGRFIQAGGLDQYLRERRDWARGINLPAGEVPQTDYWLLANRRIVATSRLRHCLGPHHGGHIAYDVRLSERRKGYGTHILALTLAQAWELGLQEVRVTCNQDNVASMGVIEKNSGRRVCGYNSDLTGKPMWRYCFDARR